MFKISFSLYIYLRIRFFRVHYMYVPVTWQHFSINFSESTDDTKPLLQDYYSTPPPGTSAVRFQPRSAAALRNRFIAKLGGPVSAPFLPREVLFWILRKLKLKNISLISLFVFTVPYRIIPGMLSERANELIYNWDILRGLIWNCWTYPQILIINILIRRRLTFFYSLKFTYSKAILISKQLNIYLLFLYFIYRACSYRNHTEHLLSYFHMFFDKYQIFM